MQTPSKISFVLFSLIVFVPIRTSLQACGFLPDHEELRYMLFNPDLLENKAWWSFFYNAKLNYLDGRTFASDDEDVLTKAWMKKIPGRSTFEAARQCLFGSLPDSILQANDFYKALQSKPAMRAYFDMARQCGALSVVPNDWHSGQSETYVIAKKREEMIASLAVAVAQEKDPFLKKKYAFQLVKLSFYANNPLVFEATYNRYFHLAKKDVLDWWALHYKSQMLERQGGVDSANYLHALIFSHSTNKMFVSRQFYSSKRLPAILRLAQNDKERADILVLTEAVNPGRSLEGIRKIQALVPNHKHLPLLIGREVNKLEDWLSSTKFANTTIATHPDYYWTEEPVMKNWKRDYTYLNIFTTALDHMDAFAQAYPDFFNLSMAYLQLMKNDPASAQAYLDHVTTKAPAIVYQRKIMEVILKSQTGDIRKTSVQNEIGELYAALLNERPGKFESDKALYSLSSYLRYTFADKGLIHLAGLFDQYATNKFCQTCSFTTFNYGTIRYFDRYASAQDLEKLIEIYNRPAKNKLEEVLLKPYSNVNYLYDVLSTKYLREGNLVGALKTLRHIPDDFWFSFVNAAESLNDDPFENNSELLGMRTMVSYNKREIAEKLYTLEQEAAADPSKRAHHYFLLGNAWYNFSDNSWFMISYGWAYRSREDMSFAPFAKKKALLYYEKALAAESQAETRAKILYMMTLLSNKDKRFDYASAYEKYNQTAFYESRNCLTTKELVNPTSWSFKDPAK